MISSPYILTVSKAFRTEKEEEAHPQPPQNQNAFKCPHTEISLLICTNRKWTISSCVLKTQNAYTIIPPDRHPPGYLTIKQNKMGLFLCNLTKAHIHVRTHTLSHSRNPASNALSQGALWGAQERSRERALWETEGAVSAGMGFSLCLWSGHWHILPRLFLWGSSGRQGGE